MKERIRSGCLVVLFLLIENGSCWLPLSIHPVTTGSTASSRLLGSSSDSNSQVLETTNGGDALTMDTPLNPSLEDLFRSAQKVSQPKQAETTAEGAHDAFRYEWGRWVDDSSMQDLMDRVNEIQLTPGVYDTLLVEKGTTSPTTTTNEDRLTAESKPRRLRVAGGEHWDCILHVLPPGTEWNGRWPTGSWAVVRALTGVAEISMLRGPNRDGLYTKATKKDLRGGGDGSLAGGTAGGGQDCVKYVGGALRAYAGKSGKTTLLEVVVRPPIGSEQTDGDGGNSNDIEALEEPPDSILRVSIPSPEKEVVEEVYEDKNDEHNDSNQKGHLGTKMGMHFEKVGGLDDQLNDIVRRVLASRANPEAAKRLGVGHVRGILLSGPPGCGKTLLARELSQLLGAREPQIVNGPEILDKFVGEAEKNIRALFAPAELEYKQVGDKSALHVIILDEMDAIARARGSVSGDTTGVRDSVVNQLLSKMDGVKEANNVLVVGLTNRPELLDPALLRPGRLEVQLRVELPDLIGRRDILRIHTRRMKSAGGLSEDAIAFLEDLGERGLSYRTEYFTGAELAGLVRSAASFALARTVEFNDSDNDTNAGMVTVSDLDRALSEVRPALGKQDEVLERRFPYGISSCRSESMERIMRDLTRFVSTPEIRISSVASNNNNNDRPSTPAIPSKLQSLLLVGAENNKGAGATALACWAAAQASAKGDANYVRLITSLDLLTSSASGSSSGEESARAAALVEQFGQASEMSNSIVVLDDIDQICAGSGPSGYSSVMIATLRALLRSPPPPPPAAASKGYGSISADSFDGVETASGRRGKSLKVLAATSRTDAACSVLNELFDETLIVPLLDTVTSVERLIQRGATISCLELGDAKCMAEMMIDSLDKVGCKTALRLMERAVAMVGTRSNNKEGDGDKGDLAKLQLDALTSILEDMAGDEAAANVACQVY